MSSNSSFGELKLSLLKAPRLKKERGGTDQDLDD
jgi:hypothetical protein